ncbi:MAG: TolC family protein [Bacteroidales bacterium]
MNRLSTTIICLFLFISGMHCQELLTLDQAIHIGLTNNYGIRISQNQVQAAKNNATPGQAGILPEIGANAGYVKSWNDARLKVVTGSELDTQLAPADLLTAGVGLTWTLFDGGNMFITYDKLRKLEEASDLGARITLENTIARVIAAYYEIVRQEQISLMLEEQVAISRFRADLARTRWEAGTGSEIDYLKGKVELNADLSRLSNQKTLAENAKTHLNDLLARDVNTVFRVADSIPANDELDYLTLVTALQHDNSSLRLARKTRQLGELDARSAAAGLWPRLDYHAGMNYYRSETDAHFIQYNRYYGPTMGLTLNVNLFDGLNQRRRYRNALLSLDSDDLQLKQAENRLTSSLMQTYNDYRNQLELIGFEQENLLLAQRNIDLARESYGIGSISSLQLREVQEDLLNAQARLINARYLARITETELLLLAGLLVKE